MHPYTAEVSRAPGGVMPSPIHVFRSITLGFLLVASVTSAASRLPEEGVALGSEIASLKAPRSSNPERQLQLSHRPTWNQFRSRHGAWSAIWNEATGTPTY